MDEALGRSQWSWGDAVDADTGSSTAAQPNPFEGNTYNRFAGEHQQYSDTESEQEENEPETPPPPPPPQPRRHYKPRTCRICLDVVEPTIEVEESATGLFPAKERVKYVSEEAELGRLISPCKCKGTQKFVHEGCLQAWRQTAPASDRNFWKCPTCGFQYRMQRLSWGRWLQSKLVRVVATILILVVTIFVLGFVADPIINLWLDPVSVVTDPLSDLMSESGSSYGAGREEPSTWMYHFLKGFFSLGLLGSIKTFFAVSPFNWLNMRWYFRGGNRRNGRDRLENINIAIVILGVLAFLTTIWKLVSVFCARTLEKLNDRIVDIHGDEPDDEDEAAGSAGA